LNIAGKPFLASTMINADNAGSADNAGNVESGRSAEEKS
jgi:hypothetical protein